MSIIFYIIVRYNQTMLNIFCIIVRYNQTISIIFYIGGGLNLVKLLMKHVFKMKEFQTF